MQHHDDHALCYAQLYALTLAKPQGPVLWLCADETQAQDVQRAYQWFFPEGRMMPFPDWDTLPYDKLDIHPGIRAQRIQTLHALLTDPPDAIITSVSAAMSRTCPPSFLRTHALQFQASQQRSMTQTVEDLTLGQYRRVDMVTEPGEMAVRGAIVDLYPSAYPHPIRLEWFDDTLESLRTFDPETQRSVQQLEALEVFPAQEFSLDQDSIERFRGQWREHFAGNPNEHAIYQRLAQGKQAPGAEYFLPLFFDQPGTLFDYLPTSTSVITVGDVSAMARQHWQQYHNRYEERLPVEYGALLEPSLLTLSPDELAQQQASLQQRSVPVQAHKPLRQASMADTVAQAQRQTQQVLLSYTSPARGERLKTALQSCELRATPCTAWPDVRDCDDTLIMAPAPFMAGFSTSDGQLTILTEEELFGQTPLAVERSSQPRRSASRHAMDLFQASLVPGDFVVHEEHGIGQYIGFVTMTLRDQPQDFMELLYAEDAKIFVPVDELGLLTRYAASEDTPPPLTRLGQTQWKKAKAKAKEQLEDLAAHMLAIQAKRAMNERPAYDVNADYATFAAQFPYEETADQARAIAEVVQDLQSPHPMDRLICADVGYGKTEVAMRAAFIAAMQGRQVAVLVPTTLLANQHAESFEDRFAPWPIRIAKLTQGQTAKKREAQLQALEQGHIDIVIGTHALLQPTVTWHDLGLLIIDEEHRFGVKQKDILKSKRSDVDVLSLTATPIPRTLHLAMSHLRDLSMIMTPPKKRLPVLTFIHTYAQHVLVEAIQRELKRGGQVYLCYNDVKQLQPLADTLQTLFPQARLGVAHGQMHASRVQPIMSRFYHHQIDILLATTIIESGIDVGNANTMIIIRADKLGLSQLHQLRGRVGRSHHQAYAYLLTPEDQYITADAQKRLEAIAHTASMGAGFELAMHDLEIRGAGELLGKEQSGNMHAIGQALYMTMLEETIDRLKRGEADVAHTPDPYQTRLDHHLCALIPEPYLPDVSLRVALYHTLAQAHCEQDLIDWLDALTDRLGRPPQPVLNLVAQKQCHLILSELGCVQAQLTAKQLRCSFRNREHLNMAELMRRLQEEPERYRLEQGQTLVISGRLPDISDDAWMHQLCDLLRTLKA